MDAQRFDDLQGALYFECSAATGAGVAEMFEGAAGLIVKPKEPLDPEKA
jgi:hypothetical protein